MISRETHAIPFFEASGELVADLQYAACRRVTGTERELPLRQVGIFQPLVCAGVDRQLGASTDGRVFRRQKDLVRGRIGDFNFSNSRLEGLGDNSLSGTNHLRDLGYRS